MKNLLEMEVKWEVGAAALALIEAHKVSLMRELDEYIRQEEERLIAYSDQWKYSSPWDDPEWGELLEGVDPDDEEDV